jgi:hypothetical protein
MYRSLTIALAGSALLALAACDAAHETTGPSAPPHIAGGLTMSLTGDGLEEYLDHAAFAAAAPELTVEGFLNPVPGEGSVGVCTGPLDATSDNECFAPGGLAEGVSINSADDQMVVLTAPFLGLSSNVVGPFSWGVALELAFPGDGVSAAAVSLLAPEGGPTEVPVALFGVDGAPLGSGAVPVGEMEGAFWGVVSEVPVGRIVFSPGERVGLLLEEVAFSTGEGGRDEPGGGEEAGLRVEVRQGAIDPASRGVIPVAVYSSAEFDATELDLATLRFGPGEASPMDERLRIDDLDGDGLADLLLHFPTSEVGLRCGDTEATLSGEMVGGGAVQAVVEVRVLCFPERGRGAGARGR